MDRLPIAVTCDPVSLPRSAVIAALTSVLYRNREPRVARKNARQWLRDNGLWRFERTIDARALCAVLYQKRPELFREMTDALRVRCSVQRQRVICISAGAVIDPPRPIDAYRSGKLTCEAALQAATQEIDDLRTELWTLRERNATLETLDETLRAEILKLRHGKRT